MPRLVSEIRQLAARRPQLYLAFCLLIILLAALAVRHGRPLEVPLQQFCLGAQQILDTHHIQSTFLPIGYSAFLGYLELLARPYGPLAMQQVVFFAQVGVLWAILGLGRSILRHFTSTAFATTAALIVALDPVLLFNANRVTDADMTLALVLGVLASFLRLQSARTYSCGAIAGLALGAAVVVRPNLLLLALLLLLEVRGTRFLRSLALVGWTYAVTALFCAGVTAAVHGRPFLPQNGPYNLYAGFNPETEGALLTQVNGEASIVPSMRNLGMHATLDWNRQSDQEGVDDIRDRRYIPFYKAEAARFVRQQPGKAAFLTVLKLFTFLRPVHDIPDHSSTAFRLSRSAVKSLTLLPLLVWIALLVYNGWRPHGLRNPMLFWAAVLYTLPFVVTNSDPRFRTSLEGVVFLDLARMVYQRFWPAKSAKVKARPVRLS